MLLRAEIAYYAPALLAILALAIAWRKVREHRVLFFVFTGAAFAELQNISIELCNDFLKPLELAQPADMYALINQQSTYWLYSDAVAAAIGGVLAWRLAVALDQIHT